MVSTSLT
ncbi:P63C domain protein, partial [Haemophilus influenzae]